MVGIDIDVDIVLGVAFEMEAGNAQFEQNPMLSKKTNNLKNFIDFIGPGFVCTPNKTACQ